MTPLDELEQHFAEIVELMPPKFNSHEFILVLAHRHQRLYVRALAQYSDNDTPFKTLHGQIAKRLKAHSKLVESKGRTNSRDIFGHDSEAEKWEKVANG